mmetsp:Transcript_33473/g.64113  ORF Transcript_33473/g.64113 Transcript_33473/m.64113 type:complete len:289 (-) Transcript_33473:512-1378(-)
MNSRETLRHRNVGSGGELREPLLRQDSDADELDHGHEIEPGHCSPLGPLKKCAEFLIHLARTLGLLRHPAVVQHELVLSEIQRDRLEALWAGVAVMYDGQDARHAAALRRLWELALPGRTLPESMVTPEWKDMGWQGTNPATDFRSAGLISLQHLLYLGERHPRTFQRLLNKEEGTRSEWEYPFAVGGVNISFMLTEMLQLRKQPEVPQRAPFRGFAKLLAVDDCALEELFVATFELLDYHWLDQRASYMEFPHVMSATKKAVEEALSSQRFECTGELVAHIRSQCHR